MDRNQVPMRDDDGSPLFTWPSARPQLIGSKCKACGEIVFPRRAQCPRCYTETMEQVLLSTRGKVYCSSVSHLPPALYKGPVPYAVGHVELPERVLIPTTFTGVGAEPLPIGTEVELVIEEWDQDEEGNTVMQQRFRPI